VIAISNQLNPQIDTDVRLSELKTMVKSISDYFDNSKRIIYYDYPVHLNVGDLLINLGTEEFFREHKLNIWRRYFVNDLPHSIRGMDDSVVILCHGGGNFGDLWQPYQRQRELLFERYPRNRIIVLPQTCYFSSQMALSQSVARLLRHQNCHFFVRDFTSYSNLRDAGLEEITAMPDMAHMLFEVLKRDLNFENKPTLNLFRSDRESAIAPGNRMMRREESSVDWEDLITQTTAGLSEITWKSMRLMQMLGLSADKSKLWYPIRDRAVKDAIHSYSSYGRINTDRLHAMILGILLGHSVYFKDNSYGKLSTYYQAWLRGVDRVSQEV
jgi:exopolysaccharide biosynthesis predicted pyruvyltransferase EpsI